MFYENMKLTFDNDLFEKYVEDDVRMTKELLNERYGCFGVRGNSGRYPRKLETNLKIKKVIFSMPATIVL